MHKIILEGFDDPQAVEKDYKKMFEQDAEADVLENRYSLKIENQVST